jgi:hypothetical protein
MVKTEIKEIEIIKKIQIDELTKEERSKLRSQINLEKLGDKDDSSN